MSITYPLELPSSPPGFRSFEMTGHSTVGRSVSPFTGSQQTYEWPGAWWTAKGTLPPMVRADAERWIAWMLSLRGSAGTFLLGDPNNKALLGNAGGSPWVATPGQTGKTLTIVQLTGTLKAGDYFQIGGENRLLYSQAFDNAAWGCVTVTRPSADTIVAYDETTTAEALTATGVGSYVYQLLSMLTAGQMYTFSVYLKVPSSTKTVNIAFYDGNNNQTFTSCALTTSWQRFSVTGRQQGNSQPAAVLIGAGSPSWDSGTIHAWGAQLELGAIPSVDYFPTTATPQISTRRLHKNLTDASGSPCTLDIFPPLRESPISTTVAGRLNLVNPRGQFRMASNDAGWTVDVAKSYGLGFEALEAI